MRPKPFPPLNFSALPMRPRGPGSLGEAGPFGHVRGWLTVQNYATRMSAARGLFGLAPLWAGKIVSVVPVVPILGLGAGGLRLARRGLEAKGRDFGLRRLPMDRASSRVADPSLGQSAHLVGLGGRGMSGLAQILAQRGFSVSGSAWATDRVAERLRKLGIRVHHGHAPGHVPRAARLLVYAPDVEREDPERLVALRRGVPQASFPELLTSLSQQGYGIAVAGSRGVSATAAMIGWTLTHAGLDPTVVLGTLAPQLGGWGRMGAGKYCVVEAVEGPNGLAPEAPLAAVVLNMGREHQAGREAQIATVHKFAASVPAEGFVLGSAHSAAAVRSVQGVAAEVEMFSLSRGCAWWGADLREDRGRYRFRAFHRGRFVAELRLQVPGKRNVLCALAAVAVCDRLEMPLPAVKEALEEFTGLARGLESRGSYRGVTLVDDEAEEPRAVAEALGVCRQMFGPRRLWSLVRPEVPAAWAPFAASFAHADCVLVTEAQPGPRLAGQGAGSFVDALAAAGVPARWAADLEAALAELDRNLQPGDVLLTLGAGDVGKVADALTTRRAARDHHGE